MPQQESSSSSSSWMVIVFDPKDPIVPYLISDRNNIHTNNNNIRHEIVSLTHPGTGDESDFLLVTTTTTTPITTESTPASITTTKTEEYSTIYQVEALDPTTTTASASSHKINSNKNNKYGSFMVGSRVVQNGTLHIATRMDPLFFVLHALCSASDGTNSSITKATTTNHVKNNNNNNNNHKWQPLEQLDVPPWILKCLRNQTSLQHLCAVNNQLGDEMLLYKLNEEKVLHWILQKQERIFQTLKQQKQNDVRHTSHQQHARNGQSAGFNLVEEDTPTNTKATASTSTTITTESTKSVSSTATSSTTTSTPMVVSLLLSSEEELQIQHSSIQLVCEYLNPNWQSKLLQHFNLPSTILYSSNSKEAADGSASKKRSWDAIHNDHNHNNIDDDATMMMESKSKSTTTKAQSMGLKKLQKVSTKGMKSLTSFFGTTTPKK